MYPIILLPDSTEIRDEQLGSKRKFWFQGEDGAPWLFKFSRDGTGEDWAEKVGSEIGRKIRVNTPRIELANYQGNRGSISKSFVKTDPKESLVHGNEILAGQILGYDPQKRLKQSDHTLANIVSAVEKLVPSVAERVLRDLAWYPVLDALIGNTDRHHENWGFLTYYDENNRGLFFRLAPSFDHASSLGRELTEERATEILGANNGIERYVRRGHGGVYWAPDGKRGPCPLELVELAATKYPKYFSGALNGVARVPLSEVTAIVDQVPDSIMTPISRQFAKELLEYNYDMVTRLVQ